MNDTRFILSEDVQDAINEFYDYSYLLKEGRQLKDGREHTFVIKNGKIQIN